MQLHQVHGGDPDYVEVVNRGTRSMNLVGLGLAMRFGGDAEPTTYRFPADAIVGTGQVFRAVDVITGLRARERALDGDSSDLPDAGGWVALCAGPCDLTSCRNVLDYVEKQGSSPPPGPPPCASFSPAPVAVTTAGSGDSLVRSAYAGAGATALQTDWAVGAATRD